MKAWSVYLLRNERGALYTGISNDPTRRLAEHRSRGSRAAKYTKSCKSLSIVYCCEVGAQGLALKIESRIKKMKKARKEELVLSRPDCGTLLVWLGMADSDKKRESPA